MTVIIVKWEARELLSFVYTIVSIGLLKVFNLLYLFKVLFCTVQNSPHTHTHKLVAFASLQFPLQISSSSSSSSPHRQCDHKSVLIWEIMFYFDFKCNLFHLIQHLIQSYVVAECNVMSCRRHHMWQWVAVCLQNMSSQQQTVSSYLCWRQYILNITLTLMITIFIYMYVCRWVCVKLFLNYDITANHIKTSAFAFLFACDTKYCLLFQAKHLSNIYFCYWRWSYF